jgi:hypothetical protein
MRKVMALTGSITAGVILASGTARASVITYDFTGIYRLHSDEDTDFAQGHAVLHSAALRANARGAPPHATRSCRWDLVASARRHHLSLVVVACCILATPHAANPQDKASWK